KEDWESEKLIALARRLQPGIIINNRTGIEQDLWTPEQVQPTEWQRHPETGELVVWEACQTFSGSWGYFRDETTWKSPEMLIQLLINTVSLGGNMIMNVGPTARGYFDKRAEKALAVFAEWMRYNSRSIYGCTMAEPGLTAPQGCRFTQSADGKRLYVHLMEYPFNFLALAGLKGKVKFAQFLHDGSELTFTDGAVRHIGNDLSAWDQSLVIKLPVVKPDVVVPVIELFLK
ncbi:MAG: alpha-L-fucosidase, partial [Clostridia bacterium]